MLFQLLEAIFSLFGLGRRSKGRRKRTSRKIFSFESAASKGARGENRVKRVLGDTTPGNHYVIHDLILQTEQGRTAQIDHVFICSHGVFSIETKNYSGQIYGNETQLQWTQVLAYGKEKHQFYNPIKQNATHVYQLKKLFDRHTPIFSAIVFVNGTIMNKGLPWVYDFDTFQALIRDLKHKSGTLSLAQMEQAYQTLQRLKSETNVTNQDHIRNICQMKNDIAHNICPRCGSPLVERHGKNGIFLGCKSYPNCKFTKQKPTK